MMNWMMRMASQSQSENCLAVSGDFSDHEEEDGVGGNDLEVELLINEQETKIDFIKHRLSSSSSSTSPPSTTAPSKSRTASSLSLNLNLPQTTDLYNLSPLNRWLILPSCTLTFMVILPFINGCLYTVGYRIGKRLLKIILNK